MKKTIFIVIVLIAVGAWMGLNFAKNRPLFSNPFEDEELRERASEMTEKMTGKVKDTAREMLDEGEEKVKEASEK